MDSLEPGTLDVRRLSNDPLADTDKAITTATLEYDIPALVDAIDVVNNPDEHSNTFILLQSMLFCFIQGNFLPRHDDLLGHVSRIC